MKRSKIARKTPLRARKPLSARKPMQKARRKVQKDNRWRSPAYLAWVRALPCCLCGGMSSDAHHAIGLGWGLSGMGLTAPDSFAMAVCRTCHRKIHNEPELQEMQPRWLRHTLRSALAEGWPGDIRIELMAALRFIDEREAV